MRTKLIAALILILILYQGCITYNINEQYLIGNWADFKLPRGQYITLGSENSIRIYFKPDSFFYVNKVISDMFRHDSCDVGWSGQCACGKYYIKENLLHLEGHWTDNTFRNIVNDGCFNKGILDITYRCEILEKKIFQLSLLDSTSKYRTGVKSNLRLYKE